MEKSDTKSWKCVRGVLAILLAFIAVAVVFPNTGHFAIDPTTHKTAFERNFNDTAFIFAAPIIPLICVFLGMFRHRKLLEHVGWALLVILFVVCLRC
ncbi:MAG TPA: hypothetical protein VHG71_05595 [Verrucomicrobiae bacterium]|nr:hypothetical protein [Verrucomicrobiae bacterium]